MMDTAMDYSRLCGRADDERRWGPKHGSAQNSLSPNGRNGVAAATAAVDSRHSSRSRSLSSYDHRRGRTSSRRHRHHDRRRSGGDVLSRDCHRSRYSNEEVKLEELERQLVDLEKQIKRNGGSNKK